MHKSDKAIKDLIAGDGVLGAFALVPEFFSYFALAVYTFERSQILGGVMFVAITFSCILGAAYHVKCGFAEYVFLQLGRDRTAKDMMLDLSSLKIFK